MTNEPFLTQEHCPKLWELGVRPGMKADDAKVITSQIMTCANVYALAKYEEEIVSMNNFANPESIEEPLWGVPAREQLDTSCAHLTEHEIISRLYFAAYGEFSSYLRYLMIYYNSQITDSDLLHIDVPLIDYIKTNKSRFSHIIFNSYNYDILMERLLWLNGLPFKLGGFNDRCSKIVFYKPHGSISFSYKKTYPIGTTYRIPYNELSFQQRITLQDFNITYRFEHNYPKHNGMVPPYGDGERYQMAYFQKIRNAIIKDAEQSRPIDLYYIIGSAYGNVDRFELDRINTSFNKWTSVTYVDPFPNKDYEAVLSSLFPRYQQVPVFPV